MTSVYQCNVIVCAMFLTGQASNPIIARFAKDTTGIEMTYARWAAGAIVPGLVSLIVVPWLLYRVFPPEIKHTPAARDFASQELTAMGPMKWSEWLMLAVFGVVALLWMTNRFHGIDYAAVALLGISVLLVTGVLEWEDLITEKAAWGVFIWYGGLIRMAEALGQTGLTKRFAEAAAGLTTGWKWWLALASLLLIYFYAHYVFASITAHVTAMFVPFLIVILAAGAPPFLAVLSLAYFSNLSASLTHYGTTPAPIYFGAGYTTQRTWWWLGLITSITTIIIWSVIGVGWWKILSLW
jgi:DASS family divalent anion:Na+ symporter